MANIDLLVLLKFQLKRSELILRKKWINPVFRRATVPIDANPRTRGPAPKTSRIALFDLRESRKLSPMIATQNNVLAASRHMESRRSWHKAILCVG
jgi:hypothetical protein